MTTEPCHPPDRHLHTDTGQAALATAGLHEAFTAHARPEGQEFRQYTADGALVEHTVPGPDDHARPEIDRGDLRAILLGALGEHDIRWNTSVAAVAPLPEGAARVDLDDGTSEEFDLVVGADGAWSRVRPALSAAIPRYSGNTFVEAWFDDVDHRRPAVADLVGNGMMAAFDPGDHRQALIAQRNGDGRVRVYIALRDAADWADAAGVDPADDPAIAAHLLRRYSGWAPTLHALIDEHDGSFIHRPIHLLPVPHHWNQRPGVTLLGDAAHLMPPVNGQFVVPAGGQVKVPGPGVVQLVVAGVVPFVRAWRMR